jgi:hypothetical protein
MHATASPPAWAEAALRSLLALDRAESVSGDLLEEYRDEKRAALGARAADVWYLTQVAGICFRKYGGFGAVLIMALVAHDLFNTFRDPAGVVYFDMPSYLVVPEFTVFMMAGVYGAWVTGRARGGVAAAVGTYLMTWVFMAAWWMATFYPFAQFQETNPYWIGAWHYSDAPGESFEHWIFWDNVGAVIVSGGVMLLLSVLLGSVGGTIGKLAGKSRRLAAKPPASRL